MIHNWCMGEGMPLQGYILRLGVSPLSLDISIHIYGIVRYLTHL